MELNGGIVDALSGPFREFSGVALDRAVKLAWVLPLVLFGLNALLGPLLEAALGWHVAARVLLESGNQQ